jgi:DNA-binding transcriptional LysR family regulator
MAILVSHLSTATQAAVLRDGNIDVAFGYLPSAETGEVVSELIHDDPLVGVIIPARHPLASKEQLWLRDLASLPLLGISRELNPVVFDSILAGLADRGLIPDMGIVQAVGIHAVSLVAQGDCWKLASETMVKEADAHPEVVYRRFSDAPLPFGLWLRRVGQTAAPMVQQFGAICRVMGTALSLKSRPLLSLLALQNLGLMVQIQALFF